MAIHPAMPKTVIIIRCLYLNIFLKVTFWLKFNRLHKKVILSNKIFLPTFGALGLIISDGLLLRSTFKTNNEAPTVHKIDSTIDCMVNDG